VFKIYLPCIGKRPPEQKSSKEAAISAGTETLLLVEDERAVRKASAEFLAMLGYKVLEAKDGVDALAVAKQYGGPIHLLVTDVVMPNMSGGELAKRLGSISRDIKFLFVSGYAGKTVLDHNVMDLETNFLQKPYSLKQLAAKIRVALEAGSPAGERQPASKR
jgi:two-component system, cell cycle sensor histidine kinase and response regulator CckA